MDIITLKIEILMLLLIMSFLTGCWLMICLIITTNRDIKRFARPNGYQPNNDDKTAIEHQRKIPYK